MRKTVTSVSTMARVYLNAAVDIAIRKGPVTSRPPISPSDPQLLHDILRKYEDDVVFTHTGLRAIRYAFQRNPYTCLLDALRDHFDSILVPGFTPQFRETGEYDKRNTEPAYGMWSKLFLDDADYRTCDAIHSICVNGDYRFTRCNHHDTFAEDGCFGKLDRDNVLILNIGTPWMMTTQHHYIERRLDVPYQSYPTYEGELIDEDGEGHQIAQRNFCYEVRARRAARKLQRKGVDAGVVDKFDIGGMLVLLFRAKDYHNFVRPKVEADPYYLIKA